MIWTLISFGIGLLLLALLVLPFIFIAEYIYRRIFQPNKIHPVPVLSILAVLALVGFCVIVSLYSIVTNL